MFAAMIGSLRSIRRRRLYALMLLSALAAFTPDNCIALQHNGMPLAQKHENHHEINQLEAAWRDAILKADTAAMDALLATDYMAITPDGTLQTREQALANLRSGAIHFTSIEVSDRRVRFYRTTALVTCRAEVTGTTAGRDFSGSYRHTRVYVRNAQGNWKIVSFEASWIREPDEHK